MKRTWFITGTAAWAAADQIMKTYAEQNMDKGEEKELTEHIVLRRVENRGLCLNFLNGRENAVKILSGAAAGVVTLLYAVSLIRKKGLWRKKGLGLMAAGAWSNTFDRFARGYVVDYIGFRCGNEKVSGVTYNLGDFLIAAGAGILSLGALLGPDKNKKNAGKAMQISE